MTYPETPIDEISDDCCCCGGLTTASERGYVSDIWEHRMDGYCLECAWARCDAYPGSHRPRS